LYTRTSGPDDPWIERNERNEPTGVTLSKLYYIPNDGANKPAFQISWDLRDGDADLVNAARHGRINVEENNPPFIFSGGIGGRFEIGHYEALIHNDLNRMNTKQRWDQCNNNPNKERRVKPAC